MEYHVDRGGMIMTTDELRVQCLDCNISWDFMDLPPDCYREGHRHEIDGVLIQYWDGINLR